MISKHTNKSLRAASLLVLLIAPLSFASANPDGRRGPPGGGPPQEAITACADLTEGAACSFSSPRGDSVEGTCKAPPQGEGSLACAPAGGPPSRR